MKVQVTWQQLDAARPIAVENPSLRLGLDGFYHYQGARAIVNGHETYISNETSPDHRADGLRVIDAECGIPGIPVVWDARQRCYVSA